MTANGQLVFTDVDKVTFKGVGNTSNAVIDTTTGKIGVGVDSPDANLHVLGNCFVSTNFELGGTMTMGTVTVRAQHELSAITATGNTTPHTVEFQNAETGLVTTGNVSVGKDLTVSGNVAVDTDTIFVDSVNNRVGVGTSTPDETLSIYKEDTTAAGQTVISSITGVFSGSDAATGGNINNRGLYINLDSSATGGTATNTEEHRVWGIDVDIDVTGDSDDIKGGRFLVRSEMAENGSDQNTNIYGIDAQGQHNGSGPATNLIGVNARSLKGSNSTGLTDTMVGVQAEYEINAGTCTDAYGVWARFDRNGGAVSNSYLLYGDHSGSATTITNNYGLYVTGTDKHYLEGNVGFGTTSPSKTLDIGFADGGSPGIRFTHTNTGGIDRKTSGHEAYYTGLEAVIERYADKDVRYTGGNSPEVTHRINLGYSDSYTDSSGFFPQHHEMHFEVMNKVNDATSAATLNRIMTLRGNGNVGIGITTPSAPLDVRGVDNPDMMAMFKTVSAAMKFHTGQGGTSNNWKDTNISLSGGSGGGAILFCFTMNNSSGDRSGAILYFIRKSHTADGTTNGDWNNDSSSVFKITGLTGGGAATSLDFQRNGNKLEYRTSSVGNGYFYAIDFD